jgi:hypothetical protein
MSDHSVSKITGIGPVNQKILENQNIATIGQLASLRPDQCAINNVATFIKRAEQYIQEREPERKVPVESTQEAGYGEDEYEHDEDSRTLIEDHTWWENKVQIPCTNFSDRSGYDMKEAIIYELSLEPCNRVAFICSWVVSKDTEDKEKLCTMTYSPQLILHFNQNQKLPELHISMSETSWNKLENKHTLENVLWETNLMINV